MSKPRCSNPSRILRRQFQDLTRVARLEETMWTELFLENGDYLVKEIETIIGHLQEYADAIKKKSN